MALRVQPTGVGPVLAGAVLAACALSGATGALAQQPPSEAAATAPAMSEADASLQACFAGEAARAARRRVPPPRFELQLARRCGPSRTAALAAQRVAFERSGMAADKAAAYADLAVAVIEKNRAFQYRRDWERRGRRR